MQAERPGASKDPPRGEPSAVPRDGDRHSISYVLVHLATVAEMKDDAVRAVRLTVAAKTIVEATGIHLSEIKSDDLRDRHLAIARSRLDESAWEQAWEEGRSMTLEEAVAYALGEGDRA